MSGVANVATGPRNLIAIKARAAFDYAFRSTRFLLRYLRGRPRAGQIALHPSVTSREQLGDLVNRLSWYLPNPRAVIHVPVGRELAAPADGEPLPVPDAQRASYSTIPSHIHFEAASPTTTRGADAILLWRWKALGEVLPRLRRVMMVDPSYYSMEESVAWANLHHASLDDSEREDLRRASIANYRALRERIAGARRAYVFTTGPSIDSAEQFDYESDAFKIVCNSMVRNQTLLRRIRPQLVVFADPVFHFSPCSYAAEFRTHALAALLEHDAYCMVPELQAGLLLSHYPELRDRLIGLPMVFGKAPWNWPTPERFHAVSTGNIMTLFMLPVAAAHCEEIYVLGADGRQRSERYFWAHSSKNQFDDLMQTAFDTHPSFFRDRVYTDYYDRHCRVVAEQVAMIERDGGHVYAATPSYIPALQARHRVPTSRGAGA